eukprot:336955-Rhodomonas_salina.1
MATWSHVVSQPHFSSQQTASKLVNFPSEPKEPCKESFRPLSRPWRQNTEMQIFEVILDSLWKLGRNADSSNQGLNDDRGFRG